MIRIEFERLGAVYVQIRDAEVHRTVELVPHSLLMASRGREVGGSGDALQGVHKFPP